MPYHARLVTMDFSHKNKTAANTFILPSKLTNLTNEKNPGYGTRLETLFKYL